ncbi:MAG: DegT/DnrJ/EryC1/StrS family aminotransferase [Acidobacteriota bacterium]
MIPLVDLKAQHATIRTEIQEAVTRVLDSGRFVLGEEVSAFEGEFAAYTGTGHAVAVASGTSALHLALVEAGIGPGDEVITVAFSFVASVAVIEYAGARPVLVDIEPRSYTIDVDRIEEAIGDRTRAIIPVHLYGQPARMDRILEIARDRGILVIEDAAQAHGAAFGTRPVGGIGHLGCFSFYPTKNLGACGEGGIVVTNDAGRARRLRMLRDWGQQHKGRHELKGFNARLQALQGAILRVKLRHLDAWNDARRRHAGGYNEELQGIGIITPGETPGTRHVYHAYTIRAPQRDRIRQELATAGIGTGVHYPLPIHLNPAYSDLGYRAGDFPEAERAAREVLSLPLYPELSEADRRTVCSAMKRACTA